MNLDPLRRWEQRVGALPVPSPLVWMVLAVAFLGFGVLLGRATGPDSVGVLAAQRVPLKLLIAQAPAGGVNTTYSTEPPPLPKAEATPQASPAAAPSESSESSTPATASKASGSSSGGEGSSGSGEGSKGGGGGSSGGGEGANSKGANGGGEGSSGGGSSGGGEGSSGSGGGSSGQGSKVTLQAIKHVFVLMLSDESYATAFGSSSSAHYLTGTLEKQGELLVRYYAVAHEGLADGVALLSGQGPTEATAANCPTYADISPTSTGVDGQMLGEGCVYPSSAQTLMAQLSAKHLTWKAYVEGIDEGAGTSGACAHPASGADDPSAALAAGGTAPAYQTWRNPFVYFSSIAGSPACASEDVGMTALKGDLASEKRTASFSYIAPGPCDDGSPGPCAPGKTSGMAAANGFLAKIVPEILSSKAYKKNGLLLITVDNAPSVGEYADSSSCCGQPRFPNLPAPTGAVPLSPRGGGQVGLLLLSPFLKKGGGFAQETYNHFSLLATIEQVFGLSRLGYAGLSEVKPFSASLLSGG